MISGWERDLEGGIIKHTKNGGGQEERRCEGGPQALRERASTVIVESQRACTHVGRWWGSADNAQARQRVFTCAVCAVAWGGPDDSQGPGSRGGLPGRRVHLQGGKGTRGTRHARRTSQGGTRGPTSRPSVSEFEVSSRNSKLFERIRRGWRGSTWVPHSTAPPWPPLCG
jgi:hypothetical protein